MELLFGLMGIHLVDLRVGLGSPKEGINGGLAPQFAKQLCLVEVHALALLEKQLA